MPKEITTTKIAIFRKKEIRKILHKNEWWFSIIDIVEALTGTERPRKYWNDLKKRLEKEGYPEVSENIGQLKILAKDGKKYLTDCANTETIFRIIQSIPSPKAEPFKRWLAKNKDVKGLSENKIAAREGGTVAGKARKDLELKSGKKVSTNKNYLPKKKEKKKLK